MNVCLSELPCVRMILAASRLHLHPSCNPLCASFCSAPPWFSTASCSRTHRFVLQQLAHTHVTIAGKKERDKHAYV